MAPVLPAAKVRPAVAGDAPRIAELYVQLVGKQGVNVLPERITTIAQDPSTELFVCEVGGQVVGTALVSLCQDVMFGLQPFAVVENVVVCSAARGQGLGNALLQHIEAFCLAKNCSKIMLLSSAQRDEAHRFFEEAGFSGAAKRGFVKYRSQFQPQDLSRAVSGP
jgi:N-acetylglutamate synthase-like GNAT family acetyltransferase